ncbi:hypothetical protein DBR43_30515 [Pedobacter sp. KBW06]|uniref:phospholipase D-like domain-containing protein n=1 Tax=Pedobacter sp. KBW06 TaxID=2153359 RepID=UPI000F59E6E6|nr:phospholipase D-like domain-containing protein [Pedobacter sp. KBW06]RQO65190.1 hypothetical protein DBR43_30515 [Pedobacter sp. KBW06]
MDKFILRDKLKELLEGYIVKAAVFYTFNFDPRFFENYVMPLMVSGGDFSEEIIHNKILWRKYQKAGQIPPVSIYCDYFAKDHSTAPALAYDIFCVRMPGRNGKICNFHSKQIIILVQDSYGAEKLLFVTGSGNLTTSGWCDNFEVFSVREIKANRSRPKTVNENLLQRMLRQTSEVSGNLPSEAEQRINSFLKYVDLDQSFKYHHSTYSNFHDFLKKNIFDIDKISEIEIISPYFSHDSRLFDFLHSKENSKVKILIPKLRNNEVILKKEVFENLRKAGATWSIWRDKSLNVEVRNIHAKMYRFYGLKNMYTVIGSVNFTQPGWSYFRPKDNESNMESAVLYIESIVDMKPILQPLPEEEFDKLQFVEIEDLEANEQLNTNRNAPDVLFILDWKTNILEYISNTPLKTARFEKLLKDSPLSKGHHKKNLAEEDIKILTGNTLIELSIDNKGVREFYNYYPVQLNIENKPLDFKLSVLNILDYWNFLGDDFQSNRLSKTISERITDESGIVCEELIERKSILNEMAAYFNSLIKLENYLFKEVRTVTEKAAQLGDIKYYLLSENIDTVSYCLKGLHGQINDGKLKNLYWMILQILSVNFYERALKWKHFDLFPTEEIQLFKKDIQKELNNLRVKSKTLVPFIDGLNDKQNWIIKELKKSYV